MHPPHCKKACHQCAAGAADRRPARLPMLGARRRATGPTDLALLGSLCLHSACPHLALAANLVKDTAVEIGPEGPQHLDAQLAKAKPSSSMMRRHMLGDKDQILATVGSAAAVDTAMSKSGNTRSPELPAMSLEEQEAAMKASWGSRRREKKESRRRAPPPAPPPPPPPPRAVDCQYSEWEEWDDCTKTCAKGVQKRERRVAREDQNGGKPCTKKLHEKKDCNTEACPTTSTTTTTTIATTIAAMFSAKSGAMHPRDVPLVTLLTTVAGVPLLVGSL